MGRHRIAGLGAGLALAAALAGCANQRTPPPAAPIAAYGWALMHSPGEGEKLAYGEPNTDNVVILLVCKPRSGLVQVLVPGHQPGSRPVRLASGGKSLSIVVRPPTGDDEPDLLRTDLKADDPILAGFAARGDLAILDGGQRTALPVRPSERDLASRFLAACKSSA